MGYPMAGHLANAGHDVTVYNRTAAKAAKWVEQHGGRSAPSPADAARATGTQLFDEPGFARAHASPSIRKLARELGVDLTRVRGTGSKARVTETDVKEFVKKALTSGATAAGAGLQRPGLRVPILH